MSNDNVGERLSSLESIVHIYGKKIDKLEENVNLIHKMNVLLEIQTNTSKDLKDVVRSIDNNLTTMNHTQEKLNDKLDRVDKRVDGVIMTVEELKNDQEAEIEADTIKISTIIQTVLKWMAYSLPVAVLGGVVMFYIDKVLSGG